MSEDEQEFWENDLEEWELNQLAQDDEGDIEIGVSDSVELEED